MNNFTMEDICRISQETDLEIVREKFLKILLPIKTGKIVNKIRLIRIIETGRTHKYIINAMTNAFLAGEGLRTVENNWG